MALKLKHNIVSIMLSQLVGAYLMRMFPACTKPLSFRFVAFSFSFFPGFAHFSVTGFFKCMVECKSTIRTIPRDTISKQKYERI